MRILLTLLLSSLAASAATYCVGQTATGDEDGRDWNNILQWSSGTLGRGDTWYYMGGDYAGRTFSTAASGETVCTLKKATVTEHGPDTGWDNSYATQAVITGTMTFTTPYWLFSGSTRNENNWFDGDSYGTKVTELSTTRGRLLYWRASYSTAEYIFFDASVMTVAQPTIGHYQIDWTGGNLVTAGNISRCYVKDGNNHYFMRNSEACIVEYCASSDLVSTANNHGEVVNWYGAFGPSDNCVVRYCQFFNNGANGNGTTTPGAMTATIAIVTSDGCQIYGNLFYNNWNTDGSVGWSGTSSGYGVGNLLVYNNTDVGGGGAHGINLETSSTGCVAYNNIWYGNSAGFQTVATHDYNADDGSLGEANDQIITSAIFVNYPTDLRLATNTEAGFTLSSPYNMDMLNHTRGGLGQDWSRGAFQYYEEPPSGGSTISGNLSISGQLTIGQ